MKIANAKGRRDGSSGYTRVLGNSELGQLISRVQSTVISNGSELERIIVRMTNTINDLDVFIDNVTDGLQADGVFLCQKKVLKKSRYAQAGIEPDLLVFVVERRRACKVIELKDGDMFDTKKSEGEKQHLEQFSTSFGARIPFVTDYYICSFNQEDKQHIREGFKNRFEIEHIMTGRELCEILSINYDAILEQRRRDMQENLDYFVDQLLGIEEVRELILSKI